MDTALTHLSLDALLPELLERISEILAADSAAISARRRRRPLHQRAAIGLEEGADARGRIPFDTRIVADVAERRPFSADDDAVDPALQERGPARRDRRARSCSRTTPSACCASER